MAQELLEHFWHSHHWTHMLDLVLHLTPLTQQLWISVWTQEWWIAKSGLSKAHMVFQNNALSKAEYGAGWTITWPQNIYILSTSTSNTSTLPGNRKQWRGKSLTKLNIRWFITAQWLRRRSQHPMPEGSCDPSIPRHGWGHGQGRVENTALGLIGSRYLWPVRKPESENTSFTRSQSKCPKANPCCLMAIKVCMDVREESGETLSPCQVKGDLCAHRANVTAQQHCLSLREKCHETEPKAAPDSPWRWTHSSCGTLWFTWRWSLQWCWSTGAHQTISSGPKHDQNSWGKEGHHRGVPGATTAIPGQIPPEASETNTRP